MKDKTANQAIKLGKKKYFWLILLLISLFGAKSDLVEGDLVEKYYLGSDVKSGFEAPNLNTKTF